MKTYMDMKTYICTDHDGRWKRGTSVIMAPSLRDAKKQLDEALIAIHLKPYAEYPYTLHELVPPIAFVLDDGDQLAQGLT